MNKIEEKEEVMMETKSEIPDRRPLNYFDLSKGNLEEPDATRSKKSNSLYIV